jgi:hypothetical protein
MITTLEVHIIFRFFDVMMGWILRMGFLVFLILFGFFSMNFRGKISGNWKCQTSMMLFGFLEKMESPDFSGLLESGGFSGL